MSIDADALTTVVEESQRYPDFMRGMDRLARRALLGAGAARLLPMLAVALLSCAKPQADEPPTDKIVSEQSQAWSLVRGGDGPVSPTGTTRYSLRAVTWGGERFVAVGGEGGLIVYSDDGTDWRTASAGATADTLTGVAWGGTRFVAVGRSGAIVHSRDGIRWHKANGIDTWDLLTDIASGGEWFIAVSDHGLILRSRDGVHWEEVRDRVTRDPLHAAAWGGGRFVAVGWNGTILAGTPTMPD